MGEEDRQAHYMGFHRSSSANVRPSRKRRARDRQDGAVGDLTKRSGLRKT
jgi:hypothetical protein